jgi:hypothetical protein
MIARGYPVKEGHAQQAIVGLVYKKVTLSAYTGFFFFVFVLFYYLKTSICNISYFYLLIKKKRKKKA